MMSMECCLNLRRIMRCYSSHHDQLERSRSVLDREQWISFETGNVAVSLLYYKELRIAIFFVSDSL